MKKKSKPFSWKSAFRAGFEEKYVNLVIDSYHETLATNAGIKKVWENTRRNMLCSQMRKNKGKYGITFNIVAESEVWDENFKDKGRIDICCYLSELDEQYMAFECKRFLKNDIAANYISREYYGQGIKRFEDNIYSQNIDFGGMIAFLEEGDYYKLNKVMVAELPQYSANKSIENVSASYKHDYVYKTIHIRKDNNKIKLVHILLDYS